jgi:hypothetical protein
VTYDEWKTTPPPEPDERWHCGACGGWFASDEHAVCDVCGGPPCPPCCDCKP